MTWPDRIQQYASIITSQATLVGEDPAFVAAVGDRETLWGTSKDLDRQGPSGTGDFSERNPARWGSLLPPDGRGWGRGLMQVDFGGHREWCLKVASDGHYFWEIPDVNIAQGCTILAAARKALRVVAGPHLDAAVACAYNAGTGRVFKVFAGLVGTLQDPVKALDAVTTGRDYCSWVLDRRDLLAGFCAPR